MSSTAHLPSTVVQPSMPVASKSNLTTGTLSGTLSSSAAAAVGNRDHRASTSAASVLLNISRRVPFMRILAPNLASIELLGHRFPLRALHQRDVGHGMTVLQYRHDADDAVPLVLLHGLGRSRIEGPLCVGHRLALRRRRRQVVAADDRLRLRDLPGLVIDNHLGERVTLHRVDRELKLSVLDLVLRGDWLAFFGAGRQPALQRDLCVLQRLRKLGMLLVAIVLGPSYWYGEEPRHEERQHDRRLSHCSFSRVRPCWMCYVFCFNTV